MPKLGCKRLSYEERKSIEKMLKEGCSTKRIAQTLNKCHQTIYYELKRCKPYNADYAQQDYIRQGKDNGRQALIATDKNLAQYISKSILEESLSPVEIIKRLRAENYPNIPSSRNTIYSAIYAGLIPNVTRETLLEKRKCKSTHMFSNGLIKVPKWICEELDIQDNEDLDIDVIDGKIVIKKSDK